MDADVIYSEVLIPLGFIETGKNTFSFKGFEIDFTDVDERNIISHIFNKYYMKGYIDGKDR